MDRANQISAELESLWHKLSDLKRLESDLSSQGASASPPRTAEQVRAEIEARLGFFPPLFSPALESPSLLENLWMQQLFSFYDNPLPDLFKERLSIALSRYCASPYFIVTHACALYGLGIAAAEVRRWVAGSFLKATADLDQAREVLSRYSHPLNGWPVDDPVFEESLIACSAAIFLGMTDAERCTTDLKDLLGNPDYLHLITLLTGIRLCHLWAEGNPSISYEDHPAVGKNFLMLVRDEPQLLEAFHNYRKTVAQNVPGINLRSEESEERFRELFENATDIIYTHDFEGNLLSVNRAIERIAGYTRAEALRMKMTDIITPEYQALGHRMIDAQMSGEIPLNYELEIFSKDRNRIALGISTRPVFRSGKAVAVQGIARDITKSKKTEVALQEANKKLEAWVNELEQRTREMTLLNDMGDILRACLSTEEAYQVIVRVAQQIFPVQVGALYVIAPSRNLVESVAVWGDPSLAEHAFPPQECWALRRGRTHWVENSKSGLICRHIHHLSPDGYLCIPMMAQSEALGVLHLMQPENVKMTETKQRMAVTMSEHIAMALSNLRLHETLRSQSIRDPLTGLFNRRFMEESLELEIRRASRNQRPLGMIMIDLDHFKYFNDNFGHEAGDLLLKELGALLKGNIRGEDIACRYGGEEFTLILPEGTGAVTLQRAEFFREAIQRLDIHYHNHPLGRITASMGVAVFPDHGRTAKALFEAADKALYRSKNAGRDRVTMAG
jgi:diguanylate cyclase (GGDEF)-like protein/PAS domain S-box-containing protein